MNEAPEKVITVGASMGGFRYFKDTLVQIDPAWPVAVMFVQHIHPDHKSNLHNLLADQTDMQIVPVTDKHPIKKHTLYLPEPDKHMVVFEGKVYAVTAPKENGSRPSINTLFRSAAVNYRERVIGILLSGMLTDGTLGMKAIRECGGVTICQHPEEAQYPEMPLNALKEGYADHSMEITTPNDLLKKIILSPARQAESSVPDILISQVQAIVNHIDSNNGPENDDVIPIDIPLNDEYMLSSLLVLMQERTNMLTNLADKESMKGYSHLSKRYKSKAEDSQVLTEKLRKYMDKVKKPKQSA